MRTPYRSIKWTNSASWGGAFPYSWLTTKISFTNANYNDPKKFVSFIEDGIAYALIILEYYSSSTSRVVGMWLRKEEWTDIVNKRNNWPSITNTNVFDVRGIYKKDWILLWYVALRNWDRYQKVTRDYINNSNIAVEDVDNITPPEGYVAIDENEWIQGVDTNNYNNFVNITLK